MPPYTNHCITAALRIYCLHFLIHLKVGRARQSRGADLTKTYLRWCSPLMITVIQGQCMCYSSGTLQGSFHSLCYEQKAQDSSLHFPLSPFPPTFFSPTACLLRNFHEWSLFIIFIALSHCSQEVKYFIKCICHSKCFWWFSNWFWILHLKVLEKTLKISFLLKTHPGRIFFPLAFCFSLLFMTSQLEK